MFDVAPTELMLVAVVALIVIGPKDLPKAMRFVGHWVARARGVMRQFRSGFDSMVREAELQEMEKKWAEENARIMREHAQPVQMLPLSPSADTADAAEDDAPPQTAGQPAMVEQPAMPPQPDIEAPAPRTPKPRKPRVRKTEPKAAS